jgi:hypothetical protein
VGGSKEKIIPRSEKKEDLSNSENDDHDQENSAILKEKIKE